MYANFVLFVFWAELLSTSPQTYSKIDLHRKMLSCCSVQIATGQHEFSAWPLDSDYKQKIWQTRGVENEHKAVVGNSKVR